MPKTYLPILAAAAIAALTFVTLWNRPPKTSPPTPPATATAPDMPTSDADWPTFRANPQLTGLSPSPLPQKLRQLWKVTFGPDEAIESTAAIVQNRIYLGTMKGRILALSLADGSQLWQFTAHDSVSASPCVADGKVFVGDQEGYFYALDAATGKELWHVKTHDKIMSSAVAVGHKILVGSYDRRLRCFDSETGNPLWEFRADAQVHCSPALALENGKPSAAVIAGCDKTLRTINLNTGQEEKEADADDACAASPALFDGNAYVGNLRGDFLAIALNSGKQLWKIAGDDPAHPLGSISASAAVTNQAVFVATEDNKLLRLARQTGQVEWTFEARGGIESSPVVVPGTPERLFFGADDGTLYALDTASGKPLWQSTVGGSIKASPAVAHARLIIGTTDGALYCFGK